MRHAACSRVRVSGVGMFGTRRHSLDNLGPVALWLKLVLVLSTERSVKLSRGNELSKVRIESHLSYMSTVGLSIVFTACTHLVPGDRVQERRDPFVEKVEQHR